MSERFTRFFALPEALYAEGSPLLIEAGALLRDSQNGRLIAQLKLKNLQSKRKLLRPMPKKTRLRLKKRPSNRTPMKRMRPFRWETAVQQHSHWARSWARPAPGSVPSLSLILAAAMRWRFL